MKIICKKTGIELLTAGGFSRWATVSEHPIFRAALPELVEMAVTEWSPAMMVTDKKLLFLAIGNATELIRWTDKEDEEAPAMPSLNIIEASIRDLLKIAGWIDFERYNNRNLHYPAFIINTATCQMQTFPDMLHLIIQTRHLSLAAEKKAHRLTCLENAANLLSAKCRVGDNRKEGALLRITAEWAMQVCAKELRQERVSFEIQEDWIKMLQTSPVKLRASKFSITDVQELRDFMLDYLPHGSTISHNVIAHLNALVDCNVINDIDSGDILTARVVIDANIDSTAELDAKPERNNFSSLVEFARALAQWQLRKMHQEATAAEALKKAAIEARRKLAAGDVPDSDDNDTEQDEEI